MASDPQKALAKLLEREAEVIDQLAAIHAEMSALVNGEDGIAVKLKAVQRHFSDVRHALYTCGPYQFTEREDQPHIKKWLRVHSVGEINARVDIYMANHFYAQFRHPFPMFVKAFNTCIGLPFDAMARIPKGCKHDPPCLDDAEHTRRRGNGARA